MELNQLINREFFYVLSKWSSKTGISMFLLWHRAVSYAFTAVLYTLLQAVNIVVCSFDGWNLKVNFVLALHGVKYCTGWTCLCLLLCDDIKCMLQQYNYQQCSMPKKTTECISQQLFCVYAAFVFCDIIVWNRSLCHDIIMFAQRTLGTFSTVCMCSNQNKPNEEEGEAVVTQHQHTIVYKNRIFTSSDSENCMQTWCKIFIRLNRNFMLLYMAPSIISCVRVWVWRYNVKRVFVILTSDSY